MKRTPSKKLRILRNILLMVPLIGLLNFLMSDAFLSPENAFRREERGRLLGSSTILGREEIDYADYQGMILADAGDGVILWVYGVDISRNDFIYREKYTENVILAVPAPYGFLQTTNEVHLPIVLFDSVPKAVRAELYFQLSTTLDEEEFEKDYFLEAERSAPGYFHFSLDAESESELDGLGVEGHAIHRFTYLSTGNRSYAPLTVPVEIRFYDVTGKLIETDTVYVCAPFDTQSQSYKQP